MRSFHIVALSVCLGALLNVFLLNADTNTLASVSGGKVRTSHVNQYFQAFAQTIVPRNSSGVATDDGGDLGSSSVSWKNAHIKTGYWDAGDIKCHHTYNGLLTVSQGWMQMDGSIVNETNYDAEHSAGDWDTYIVSSLLDGKFLPDISDRHLIAKALTTKDGSVGIAPVGNAGSTINIQHSHTVTFTPRQWYNHEASASHQSFNSAGTPVNITPGGTGGGSRQGISVVDCSVSACLASDFYTDDLPLPTNSTELSAAQDIAPDAIEFVCYMRII